ncbi:MAG: aryl-sulfate sulfotransferase [Ekhidna sp.]
MKFLLSITSLLIASSAIGQLGVVQSSASQSDHYTLFHPHNNTNTYLIDDSGALLHQWDGIYPPGNTVALLPNKQLFRTGKIENDSFRAGGLGGYMELVDFDGNVSWSFTLSNANEAFHHEAIFLENGNILAIVWEAISEDEAIQMGRDPASLDDQGFWAEKIVEMRPIGTNDMEIVWEWRAKDHLIQNFDPSKDNYSDVVNPHKLDINYVKEKNKVDWIHLNSIDYLESLDLILLSSPFFNEIWIIDHSTTAEEAKASTGGDYDLGGGLLYRWGNPVTYDQGSVEDQRLFGQHNAQFVLENGELGVLLYNNGVDRPEGVYSSIDFFVTPFTVNDGFAKMSDSPFAPSNVDWSLTAEVKEDLYSRIVSGVQVLPTGNFFITEGINGRLIEMDSTGTILWEYQSPHGSSETLLTQFHCEESESFNPSIIFRASKIAPDFIGLEEGLVPTTMLEDLNCPLGIKQVENRIITVFTTNGTILKTFFLASDKKINTEDLPKNRLLIIRENINGLITSRKIIVRNN